MPWKHKQTNKRWVFCLLRNWDPLDFWPPPIQFSFPSVPTSRPDAGGATQTCPEPPPSVYFDKSADFTRVEEQTEPLMEALFPNGGKSSLGRTLYSAERRETSARATAESLEVSSSATVLLRSARLRDSLNEWTQRNSPPPPQSLQTNAHLLKMR